MRIILPNTTIFHHKALHRMKNQSCVTSIFRVFCMSHFWSKWFHLFFNKSQFKSDKHKADYSNLNHSHIGTAFDSDQNIIGTAQDKITRVSPKGIDLMCSFEGLELKAYDDGTGVCTIGYGTTVYPNGKAVQYGDQCTIEQAKRYMQFDLNRFEQAVSRAVQVPLRQNQFDALVSLAYNIGISAFQNSTLLKRLNTLDYLGASQQFDVWIKAGGKTVQGLVNRRAVEKALFLKH